MAVTTAFQTPSAFCLGSRRLWSSNKGSNLNTDVPTGSFTLSKEHLGEHGCGNVWLSPPPQKRSFLFCSASASSRSYLNYDKVLTRALQKCAVCMATAVAIALPLLPLSSSIAVEAPTEPTTLVEAPTPTKDVGTLLRDALPIHNQAIRDIQKSLEGITDCLKLPPEEAICNVVLNTRRSGLVLDQNKERILSEIMDSKRVMGQLLVDELSVGLTECNKLVEENNLSAVAAKQKVLLQIVSKLEEFMVKKFPFDVPEEYANRPLLKGRATIEVKVRLKDRPNGNGNGNGGSGNGNANSNGKSTTLKIVVDGYNSPVTAGNFVDLVARHFYDGMPIQKADGFIVQTGDPPGSADGFVDPGTGKVRTIPLEIMVEGDTVPIYGATLEELGRDQDKTRLPFNSCSTLAMARKDKDNNSASSQIFWLLKDCQEKNSELKETEAMVDKTKDGTAVQSPSVTERTSLESELNPVDAKKRAPAGAPGGVEVIVEGGEGVSSAIELTTTDPDVDNKRETVTKEINIMESIIDGVATDGKITGGDANDAFLEAPILVPEEATGEALIKSDEEQGKVNQEVTGTEVQTEVTEGDLKESEITVDDLKRSNGTTKDGQYAVFGYVVENQELLGKLQVGDVIESMRVVSGIDNLVNPSYRI